MGMYIRINGQKIKQPKNPKLETYNLTKSGRVSSGKMTMDLVDKKRKLFCDYDILSGREMDAILELIDGVEMFFTVSYVENGSWKEFIGYVGEISRTMFRGENLYKQDNWYWKDVSFNLIEQ